MQKKIVVMFVLVVLSVLSLSGCLDNEFEANIYGTWITKDKISINDMYEPEYEYLVFLRNGKYETNIFQHLFVEGQFFLKQEDGDYFFQLEYKNLSKIFQYTYETDDFQILKIKDDKDMVTIFEREKN